MKDGGDGIQQKYNIELTQIQTLQTMMMAKIGKVNPADVLIKIEHKWKIFEGWWWWSWGDGIQKKYDIGLTQIQTPRIMMMMKKRKVNPTNVSITIEHKWKICGELWWWLEGEEFKQKDIIVQKY